MYYVYIIRCRDGSLYTGWTNDVPRRFVLHSEGKGAKYTRSRRPLKLVHTESFDTSREARMREAEIKKLSREEKEALIERGNQ